MENIIVEYTKVNAIHGTTLCRCLIEAAIMSLQEERVVRLVHNDKTFKIDYIDIIGDIEDRRNAS